MNLQYLLKISADTEMVFIIVFATLFVSVATVMVREKWCFETDLFYPQKGEEPRPLIVRIVTSQEYLADVIVFAVWDLIVSTWIGVQSKANWLSFLIGDATLVIGGTLLFGVLDCLLYVIARKRANRRLRKREE